MDNFYLALILSGIVLMAYFLGRCNRDQKYTEGYCSGYNDALKDIQSMEQYDKNIQIIVRK